MFFAKGIILVEGWSEQILLPALARKLKKQGIITNDLTEAGVSIVNIGNKAFLRYSRIYLRKKEPYLDLPVAIVTDVDVPEYKKIPKKDKEGNIIKNENGKIVYEYKKVDREKLKKDSQKKREKIVSDWEKQSVKVFVAPHWTLEYSLYKSVSLSQKFKETFKSIHPQINENEIEKELAKKLINGGLDKIEIAQRLAYEIENNPNIKIDVNDKAIEYLIDAIKYVCNDTNNR